MAPLGASSAPPEPWWALWLQQPRSNTLFARKEHSLCEKTPKQLKAALFPTTSAQLDGNRVKTITGSTAMSLILLLGKSQQLPPVLGPGYETRRATMALGGHDAAPAAV